MKFSIVYVPNVGAETSLVAYSGRSQRQSRTEALITGQVTKVTDRYIHLRSYEDGKTWISPISSLPCRYL